MAIISKCDESMYKINHTIVRLRKRLKWINSLTTALYNHPNSIILTMFQSLTNTFLSINPYWKKLNYTKKAADQFSKNIGGNSNQNCYNDIAYGK